MVTITRNSHSGQAGAFPLPRLARDAAWPAADGLVADGLVADGSDNETIDFPRLHGFDSWQAYI
jgi:hypothetical protein